MSIDAGTPSLEDVVNAAIDARLRELHTALPGKVLAYDATTQTATIQPMVQQGIQTAAGRWVHETYAEIFDVPVMFMRSPSFTLTFPIPVGTSGLLVFCERDIGQWRATGQNGSPGDQRCHSMAGAVFHPTSAPDDSIVAVSNSNAVVTLNSGALLHVGASATQFVANATSSDARWTALFNSLASWVPAPVASDGGAAVAAQIKTLFAALSSAYQTVAVTKLKSE
jgi:hypothetical protein